MIRTLGPLWVVFALFAPLGTGAVAQESKPPAAPKVEAALPDACAADALKVCPKAQGAARVQCLRAHGSEISGSCKSALAGPPVGAPAADGGDAAGEGRRGGRAAGFAAACNEDASKLCADAQGRARFQCLNEHEKDLSAPCKTMIERFRSMMGQGGGRGGER